MADKKKAVALAVSNIDKYFKCMLKSSEKNKKFYSPSLTTTTVDEDGGQVIRFGDATDTRTRPQGVIFIPTQAYEECDKFRYICFDDELVKKGIVRCLTVAQYEKLSKAVPQSKGDTTSTGAELPN